MSNPDTQSVLNRASLDKFLLVLELPPALKKKKVDNPHYSIDPVQFSVFGSVVPPISVPAVILPHSGQNLHVSGHLRSEYQPLQVNYVVDNRFHNYWVLWQWLHLLNTEEASLYGGDNAEVDTIPEYTVNMSVYGCDEYNKKVIEFVYKYCFITDLGAINYDYRNNESFITSSASFSFSRIEMNLIPAT